MRPEVDELERRARELLPVAVYDYYAGGSGREETLRANMAAWRRCILLPHVLRDVSAVQTRLRLPHLRCQPGDDGATGTAYGGTMKVRPRARNTDAQLVTEARRPRSEDIAYRERRYLIMMGFRVLCFLLAILLFTQGAGWFAAIPAVGALVIPYFAVVFANGGREPTSTAGFRPYEPHLPVPRSRPDDGTPGEPSGGPGAGPAERG